VPIKFMISIHLTLLPRKEDRKNGNSADGAY
jgi:hypothetical protein